jgi:hypothetical protein
VMLDDGRLKSINGTTTGTGGVFVKNLMALTGHLITPRGFHEKFKGTQKPDKVGELCKLVNAVTTATQPATLKYSLLLPLDGKVATEAAVPFLVDADSAAFYGQVINWWMPVFTAKVKYLDAAPQAMYTPSTKVDKCGDPPEANDVVFVTLNETGMAKLAIDGPDSDLQGNKILWQGDFPVPRDSCYLVPIPKAKLFGKQTIALELSPYGSITKLQYAKTAGTNEALQAVTDVTKTLAPSAADQTTAINAQINLINAQRRLAACLANPAQCQ